MSGYDSILQRQLDATLARARAAEDIAEEAVSELADWKAAADVWRLEARRWRKAALRYLVRVSELEQRHGDEVV